MFSRRKSRTCNLVPGFGGTTKIWSDQYDFAKHADLDLLPRIQDYFPHFWRWFQIWTLFLIWVSIGGFWCTMLFSILPKIRYNFLLAVSLAIDFLFWHRLVIVNPFLAPKIFNLKTSIIKTICTVYREKLLEKKILYILQNFMAVILATSDFFYDYFHTGK